MRYRYPRRNPAPDLTLVEELDALAARVADLEAEGEFVDLYDKARPILNRHLGRHLGPSADWLNPTWRLGGDLYLFEGDDNDYTVLSRAPNEDPDEPDVIEEVEALRSLDALRRYFRTRRNPRKTPPPPPPSHTFQLTADPYQQRLFGPEAFEQRPKKRAVEPMPVDERQVDLFAPPPPPKKNPRAAENGRYRYVMSCPGSTYEDIQALQESEQTVSRATFAKAIGPQAWRDIQANLGYDRDFSITKDWHVGYYKGVFRGVPCYFLRHSRIEHIYTLDGKIGPSLAGDDE